MGLMDRACNEDRGNEKCEKKIVGKPDGKKPFRTSKCRCEDNIIVALWKESFWVRGLESPGL
jgi:hypothetical protein